jgi:hypothetical protein
MCRHQHRSASFIASRVPNLRGDLLAESWRVSIEALFCRKRATEMLAAKFNIVFPGDALNITCNLIV